MATTEEKKQYDAVATQYDSVDGLPAARIEAELIRTALGDCTGLHVLDLGGGSGLHARRAVGEANAATVDVVDISKEMLRVGQETEVQLGREGRIRWFEADLSKPLGEQIQGEGLREGGYDVVMANWVFDHAASEEDLRGMWSNVVAHIKPGGRFLGVRVRSVYPPYMVKGIAKYGAWFSDIEEIPGGVKYICGFPGVSFGCTSMESSYSLRDDIPKKLGLVDFQVLKPEETEVVRGNVEFWADFAKDPNLAVVTARKP